MLDAQDTWLFINSFAPWLAAIGTLSAVVVSLYLARRSDRIRLKVSLSISVLVIEGGGPGHGTEHVWLTVTNLSRRQAVLTQLFWKPVPWKKSGAVWITPINAVSSKLPISLGDGQSANYLHPIEDFREQFSEGARLWYTGMLGKVRLRLTKISVVTSTGYVATARLNKALRDLFSDLALASGKMGKPASRDA